MYLQSHYYILFEFLDYEILYLKVQILWVLWPHVLSHSLGRSC